MTLLSFTLPQLATILGLCFIAAELFLGIQTGFDLVLIGSCILTGGILGMVTNSLAATLLVATGLSVLYILFGRTLVKRKMLVSTQQTNIDKLMGETGVVIRPITPTSPGQVLIKDETWRATSTETLNKGDKVRVLSLEGVTLNVIKLY